MAMNFGYRHFVVVGDNITPLSQKACNALFLKHHPALPAFAGTTVDIATVIYLLESRQPTYLVRIDCERCHIRNDGALDEQDRQDRTRLTGYRMARALRHILPPTPQSGGTVIDARERFDEKRLLDKLAPTLSAIAKKKMIASVWR